MTSSAVSYRIAMAAGQDAGNRSMTDRDLAQWDDECWNVSCEAFEKVMVALRG